MPTYLPFERSLIFLDTSVPALLALTDRIRELAQVPRLDDAQTQELRRFSELHTLEAILNECAHNDKITPHLKKRQEEWGVPLQEETHNGNH